MKILHSDVEEVNKLRMENAKLRKNPFNTHLEDIKEKILKNDNF